MPRPTKWRVWQRDENSLIVRTRVQDRGETRSVISIVDKMWVSFSSDTTRLRRLTPLQPVLLVRSLVWINHGRSSNSLSHLRTEMESLSDNSNASLLSTGGGSSAAAVISTNGITDGQLADWPQLGRGNVARKENVYRMFIVDILDIVSIIFQIISW